jgi:hypothetical protein
VTCAATARTPDTQLVATPTPSWFILPTVENVLAAKYHKTQRDSLSLEYTACLSYVTQDLPGGRGRFYFIHAVRFPEQHAWIQRDSVSQRIVNYRVAASCRYGELHLHTHSKVHCLVLRGPDACATPAGWMKPSAIDERYAREVPLAFIQYGERSILGYAPDSVPKWVLNSPKHLPPRFPQTPP